jgi:ribulose-phosphate 3-epimerase
MEAIPTVNCSDEACVRRGLGIVKLLEAAWVEFDVSDGTFASTITWNEPAKLEELIKKEGLEDISIGVHCMVRDVKPTLAAWLQAGARRAIVHVEVFPKEKPQEFFYELERMCTAAGAELGLSIAPETPVNELVPYLGETLFIQLLAVKPGPSGQKFDEGTFEKLEFLRDRAPEATIAIDGGVTPALARRLKEAGADIVVSASYIMSERDPHTAYRELLDV